MNKKERFLESSYPEYKKNSLSLKDLQGIRENIKYLYKRMTKFNLIKLPAN